MIKRIPGIYYTNLTNGINLDIALIQSANIYRCMFSDNKFRLKISYYQISVGDAALSISPVVFISNNNTIVYDIIGSEKEVQDKLKDIRIKQRKLDKIAEYLRSVIEVQESNKNELE